MRPVTIFPRSVSYDSGYLRTLLPRPLCPRCLHTSAFRSAIPYPVTATGPPPAPPTPSASGYGERIDRRRRQAELVKPASAALNAANPTPALRKRFWKHVSVRSGDDFHTVYLDTRPVKNPLTNPTQSLHIPSSKPNLATAIALEWDLLTSASDALRSHLIPLTSLASRAQAVAMEDAQNDAEGHLLKGEGTRYEIINTLLRYLDTDTLLCWAPERANDVEGDRGLRERQIEISKPILSFLTQKLWPAVELVPTLSDGSILPKSQPPSTRAVVKGWMAGLPAWELVGLERAVLAGKSLCVAARLVGEWSEALRLGEGSDEGHQTFGIEEAAKACSLEVTWQTGQWGEVEDSHDVEKEDLRRQLGSVILLISGEKGR